MTECDRCRYYHPRHRCAFCGAVPADWPVSSFRETQVQACDCDTCLKLMSASSSNTSTEKS